jgi:hypothetical protein
MPFLNTPSSSLYLLTSLTFLLGINQSCFAEAWKCRAMVSYTWEFKKDKKNTFYFREAVGLGSSEDEAKASLVQSSAYVKKGAIESCQQLHENTTRCFNVKIRSALAANAISSFVTKAALEKAIVADCESQSGICTTAEVDKETCSILKEPSTEASKEEEKPPAEEVKGGEKKK